MPKITPFLWFDTEAEEAANLYVSIFPNSKIVSVTRFGAGGPAPAGSVMTVQFELGGLPLVALNGGPHYHFTEAVSFSIDCRTQDDIDYYWSKLTEGGQEGQCGWLKDRFGLSWQVVPTRIGELLGGSDPEKSKRAFRAMMGMKKLDIAALENA